MCKCPSTRRAHELRQPETHAMRASRIHISHAHSGCRHRVYRIATSALCPTEHCKSCAAAKQHLQRESYVSTAPVWFEKFGTTTTRRIFFRMSFVGYGICRTCSAKRMRDSSFSDCASTAMRLKYTSMRPFACGFCIWAGTKVQKWPVDSSAGRLIVALATRFMR